jgi:hypothetical protein
MQVLRSIGHEDIASVELYEMGHEDILPR